MTNNPLISVVLPVWNGEKYLDEALKSILNQSFRDFELIIVNDCSSDRSIEIANQYLQRDERVKIITNSENLKLPRTLNVGFAKAKGSYYTWTSDDNILHQNFLDEMLRALQASNADIIYSDMNIIDGDGKLIESSQVGNKEELIIRNIIGASFLYKKEVHRSLNGFDANCYLFEDYDFWVRAYLKGYIFHKHKKIVYDYRRHPESLTATSLLPKDFAIYRYQLRTRFPDTSRSLAFEARKMLMGYRKSIGNTRWSIIVFESFCLNPMKSIQLIYSQSKDLLVKIFPKGF